MAEWDQVKTMRTKTGTVSNWDQIKNIFMNIIKECLDLDPESIKATICSEWQLIIGTNQRVSGFRVWFWVRRTTGQAHYGPYACSYFISPQTWSVWLVLISWIDVIWAEENPFIFLLHCSLSVNPKVSTSSGARLGPTYRSGKGWGGIVCCVKDMPQ